MATAVRASASNAVAAPASAVRSHCRCQHSSCQPLESNASRRATKHKGTLGVKRLLLLLFRRRLDVCVYPLHNGQCNTQSLRLMTWTSARALTRHHHHCQPREPRGSTFQISKCELAYQDWELSHLLETLLHRITSPWILCVIRPKAPSTDAEHVSTVEPSIAHE